ncbi:MAG TPA: dinitrogenase iron-molybdenum cofactor biosynthesis protein [Desulfobacterales bacterium]|nr:dinitrogenase iron-molybdenum cofactor biosynthesis protein [Desulfobacterales bacterium]
MANMKIAVASTDGVNVNQHFGRAEKFLIYEVVPASFNLVEELEVAPYSSGKEDKKHQFDQARFAGVAEKLRGCEKMFTAKIGDIPAAELRKMGVEPVVYEGLIADINL